MDQNLTFLKRISLVVLPFQNNVFYVKSVDDSGHGRALFRSHFAMLSLRTEVGFLRHIQGLWVQIPVPLGEPSAARCFYWSRMKVISFCFENKIYFKNQNNLAFHPGPVQPPTPITGKTVKGSNSVSSLTFLIVFFFLRNLP